MNLATWCIKNNRTAIVVFLLILLAGLHAFFTISRREDPEFTIRVALVAAEFPGASPQKIEELVTDPIERKIQGMAEVETITSESMTGVSMVQVEIGPAFKKDIRQVWSRLRNKMEDVKGELPEGVNGPYVNDEFGDVFPVVVALTGDGFSYRELKDIADDTRDKLLQIKNVAKVELSGTQEERIFVEFSNTRLAEMGFTPDMLADSLDAQNVLQPGGEALVGPEMITIEVSGEFTSLEQLKKVSLRQQGSAETVYLSDIARIRRGFVDPPSSMARFNMHPSLMISISMAQGGKVTDMGARVKEVLAHLQEVQPIGITYNTFIYQPKYVTRQINSFMGNLGQAFFFVVVVMLLFCGIRMGLIAGVLVPVAMLMCIGLMPVFDIKLQQVSIASLIIALGMLVDNGIVTSEDMLVRLARGDDRLVAVRESVRQLWLPLLAASLTTICAFMPIALADADVGEFCLSLFQVVSITLLSSWLLSITLIPMLCYYFLKPKQQKQGFDGRLYRGYRKLLFFCLRRRLATLLVIFGLFIGSIWVFQFVPSIFFPPNSREMMLIDFWQPYGTDIRTTRDRTARLEHWLLDNTNVLNVGTFVGEGGPRWMLSLNVEQENPNYAFLIINTKTKECVKELMDQTREHLGGNYPDCRFTVKELETGPPVGAPIQVRLSGADIDTLYALRNRIAAEMSTVPGVINIRDDWGAWTKKLEVHVNQEQAKLAGFTSRDVASSLRSQISGLPATGFREGRNVIPIEIRSRESYRRDLGKVESMTIYSFGTSKNVPLLQIAGTRLAWQPSDIRRRNKTRTMTIKADISGRFASEVLMDIMPKVEAIYTGNDWPRGYEVTFAGEEEENAKAMGAVTARLPLALGLLALVLIGQFNSIRRPIIIALTIPPMMIGIVFGLLLTGTPFGFMSFLGMISLMGIIVNNAIMMIDRIEIERSGELTLPDAIVVAAQKRFRPILMTTITTIVGLIPLSIQGGAMWRPMANTIIFGLAFATVLTLVLCPVLYSLLFRANFKGYAWTSDVFKKSME